MLTKPFELPKTDGSGNNREGLRRALGLLKEAGWTIKDRRLVDKDGKPMAFTILLNDPTLERIALPYQQWLQRLGIAVNVRTVDSAQFVRLTDEYDFDMTTIIYPGSDLPGNELRDEYSCEGGKIQGGAQPGRHLRQGDRQSGADRDPRPGPRLARDRRAGVGPAVAVWLVHGPELARLEVQDRDVEPLRPTRCRDQRRLRARRLVDRPGARGQDGRGEGRVKRAAGDSVMPDFYEFFAGGGMARAGLGPGWDCTFANDFSAMKAAAYRDNWGSEHFFEGDVASIQTCDLPGRPALVWASTPCQDLSLAGDGVGMGAPGGRLTRSGAFWPWISLMRRLAAEARKPPVVVFENVTGALSSNRGADFETVCRAFAHAGYVFGPLQIDAKLFLPQSRPRLFIVGFDNDLAIPPAVRMLGPQTPWHPAAIQTAYDRLPEDIRARWAWWGLPQPMLRRPTLDSLIDEQPAGAQQHAAAATQDLIAAMSPANADRLKQAQALGRRIVGTIYKRTRPVDGSKKVVRAEVRFDGVAGCLRTPSGGSSRQTVIIVEGQQVRTRLLSPREAARLMGLPETYRLPSNYNDAYHLAGDGVAVPVVRFLAQNLFEPLVAAAGRDEVGTAGESHVR